MPPHKPTPPRLPLPGIDPNLRQQQLRRRQQRMPRHHQHQHQRPKTILRLHKIPSCFFCLSLFSSLPVFPLFLVIPRKAACFFISSQHFTLQMGLYSHKQRQQQQQQTQNTLRQRKTMSTTWEKNGGGTKSYTFTNLLYSYYYYYYYYYYYHYYYCCYLLLVNISYLHGFGGEGRRKQTLFSSKWGGFPPIEVLRAFLFRVSRARGKGKSLKHKVQIAVLFPNPFSSWLDLFFSFFKFLKRIVCLSVCLEIRETDGLLFCFPALLGLAPLLSIALHCIAIALRLLQFAQGGVL